jgi:hypothetical protein
MGNKSGADPRAVRLIKAQTRAKQITNALREHLAAPELFAESMTLRLLEPRQRKRVADDKLIAALKRYQAEHPKAGYATTIRVVAEQEKTSQEAVRKAMRQWPDRPKVGRRGN